MKGYYTADYIPMFYDVPAALFTSDEFKGVSAEAKVLYGIMLKRASTSRESGWLDDDGRVYILISDDEICGFLGCTKERAAELLDELENKADLIMRSGDFLDDHIIYPKKFGNY